MLFTELTPLVCKNFDSTLVFDEQLYYEPIQEYLKACLQLQLPECALMFFLEAAEVMRKCIVQDTRWPSYEFQGISSIRFLKEVAEDVANLGPSTKLYRACQRIMPKLFNTYLDHVVG